MRQREDVLSPSPSQGGSKVQAEVVVNGGGGDAQSENAQATLTIDPESAKVKPGDTTVVQVKLEKIEDLFSASLILKYDPQALAVEDVRNGDFLSGGTQEVAIIQRIDKDSGLATIFTTRQPNTAGVSGKGVLLNVIVRHLTGTPATLRVSDAGLRNSRQKAVPVNVGHSSVNIE